MKCERCERRVARFVTPIGLHVCTPCSSRYVVTRIKDETPV